VEISNKRDLLIKKIDHHLRTTARQLVKFDTLNETLHYLVESFWEQFSCDYVSIILTKGEFLEIKMAKGECKDFGNLFPLERQLCAPRFLMEPVCFYTLNEEDRCTFINNLENEGFSTWFTVPIMENGSSSLGVCVIGYRNSVPLILDADKLFAEFGKDIATAIGIAVRKENEKKKIKGMEWLKENVYLGLSIEQLIKNIVERAGKGTFAESAYVYLFNEVGNYFIYQPPSFGPMISPTKITIDEDYSLSYYFPFLEREGGDEMSIPLIVNLKTIGVLHVVNKTIGKFTREDLELLQLLASYVSVLIENARLYKSELEEKSRLEKLMVHHQELVKQTLVGEGFLEITNSLSQLIGRTVVLFDRFFRPISYSAVEDDQNNLGSTLNQLDDRKRNIMNTNILEQWIKLDDGGEFGVWKVIGGGDLLGYLGLKLTKKEFDMVLRMTLNHALNVYAIQFIKQKLVLEAKEQVKDSFINQLFAEKIEDKDRLIEYSNLFNLNLFEPHIIGMVSIEFSESVYKEADLLDIEAKKTWIWERIRENLIQFDPGILLTRSKEGFFIIIASAKEEKDIHIYWETVYKRMKKIISLDFQGVEIFLGISQSVEGIENYYIGYKQALQTLKIVCNRFRSKGFLSFDSLGSYTVLHNLQDMFSAKLFLRKYLDPLLNYSTGKGKDLFETLRTYLYMNGNLKETAERLFIHRSSLKYRLEKISELLDVDIEDAEERFNLMLAYKLYDLFHFQEKE
jgi:DNA-binding PucR family transcriptional regulator